jgi:pimeloyl-ACP methyl ester carboxylesterase
VLLHGLAGSGAYLRDYAERLGRTHHAVVVDLPGHGRSDPLHPFTFAEAVHVIASAIERAGVERPVVLGHSFGVPLAVEWGGAAPVAGLVLCSPVGMIPLQLARARYVLPFQRALSATVRVWSRAAVAWPVSRRLVFGWFVGMESLTGLTPALGREMLRDAARAAAVVPGVIPALAGLDMRAAADRVHAPALVLWGERDRSGAENGRPLAAALRARTVELPGVGHMPMLEAPYAFGTAVADFLSATVPA